MAKPVDNAEFSIEGKEVIGERGWERVEWVLDESMESEIEACKARNVAVVGDSEGSQLWWNEYGVEWIKKTGMSILQEFS